MHFKRVNMTSLLAHSTSILPLDLMFPLHHVLYYSTEDPYFIIQIRGITTCNTYEWNWLYCLISIKKSGIDVK